MKLTALLALVLCLVACRDRGEDAPLAARDASTAREKAQVVAKAVALDERRARALVERWVSVQNAQDFAGYEQLYATRFTGIKRAGQRISRFDRDGWLRDRKGMFARGFTLTVEGLEVRTLGASAQVSFQQTFRSPKFSDKGPKQLIVVLDQGSPRIAREEMLDSRLQQGGGVNVPDDAAFSFVRTVHGRVFWLSNRSPEGLVVEAEPELLELGAAFAKLPPEALPSELKAHADKLFVVRSDGAEPACDVKLQHWGVLAHFEPHFGDRSRWSGQEEGPKPTREQIAREVFGPAKVTGGAHKIAVDITDQVKACKAPRWARDKSLTPLPVYATQTLASAELQSLSPRIRALPAYKEAQKSFVENDGRGAWEETPGATMEAATVLVGERSFVYATASYFGECSGFNGVLNTVFRVEGKRYVAMPAALGEQTSLPLFATDLNADGVPEWVGEARLIAWDGKAFQITIDAQPPSFDCPC